MEAYYTDSWCWGRNTAFFWDLCLFWGFKPKDKKELPKKAKPKYYVNSGIILNEFEDYEYLKTKVDITEQGNLEVKV